MTSHRIGDPARNQLSFDLDRLWLSTQRDRYARQAERGLAGGDYSWNVFFWLREQAAPEAHSVWKRLLDDMKPQVRPMSGVDDGH